MRPAALTRLAVLLAAIACLLIAFGVVPALKTPTELAPASTVIDNDTTHAVVLVHCSAACPASGGTTVEPGHELPAGPPHVTWQVRTAAGDVVGCLSATAAGQRLPVSRTTACPA